MHVDLQFVLRDYFDGVSPGGQNSWRDTRVGLGGASARPLEGESLREAVPMEPEAVPRRRIAKRRQS